jgi:hypothetical protein
MVVNRIAEVFDGGVFGGEVFGGMNGLIDDPADKANAVWDRKKSMGAAEKRKIRPLRARF